MRKPLKRPFTLIELLLSLSLTAIIIALLITFSFRLFLMERKIKIAKQELLSEIALEIKLRTLFSDVLEQSQACFYTDEKAKKLFFIYDNQIDLDPQLSGKLKGEIFLDENKNLTLITCAFDPSLKQKPASEKILKTEILASKIETLSFTFFQRKTIDHPKDKSYQQSSVWQEKDLPDVFQIKLEKAPSLEKKPENNLLLLTFFSDRNNFICYEE